MKTMWLSWFYKKVIKKACKGFVTEFRNFLHSRAAHGPVRRADLVGLARNNPGARAGPLVGQRAARPKGPSARPPRSDDDAGKVIGDRPGYTREVTSAVPLAVMPVSDFQS